MTLKKPFKAGVCALAVSGLFTSAAYAQDNSNAVRLEPSSNWNVEFAESSCRLTRLFGEGEKQSLLYLERFQPGDSFTLVLAGKPLDTEQRQDTAFFQFGSTFPEFEAQFTPGQVGTFDPALIADSLTFKGSEYSVEAQDEKTKIDSDLEKEIDWLSVRHHGGAKIVFALGSLGEPMKVLRSCTDDLLTSWGLDLEKHRTLARLPQPKGEAGAWLLQSISDAGKLLKKDTQGLVNVRLSVDEQGKPSDCHIQKSDRPAKFDKAVCARLMRRARFEPAETSDGERIASYWHASSRFSVGKIGR